VGLCATSPLSLGRTTTSHGFPITLMAKTSLPFIIPPLRFFLHLYSSVFHRLASASLRARNTLPCRYLDVTPAVKSTDFLLPLTTHDNTKPDPSHWSLVVRPRLELPLSICAPSSNRIDRERISPSRLPVILLERPYINPSRIVALLFSAIREASSPTLTAGTCPFTGTRTS
jgi:hypothetical protein